MLDDGLNAYRWDAENRLIQITNKTTGHISQFKYDGFSRRTVIIERASATATPVETHYLWCGNRLCESHAPTGVSQALYFGQGEIAVGSNAPHFYARDNIGSVVQVVNANGTILGLQQYSPYGKIIKASGIVPTFGYAGMFQHSPSALNLTWFRAYESLAGRWLSRDPIAEDGGLNLYAYVKGSPLIRNDKKGLLGEIGIPEVGEWPNKDLDDSLQNLNEPEGSDPPNQLCHVSAQVCQGDFPPAPPRSPLDDCVAVPDEAVCRANPPPERIPPQWKKYLFKLPEGLHWFCPDGPILKPQNRKWGQ